MSSQGNSLLAFASQVVSKTLVESAWCTLVPFHLLLIEPDRGVKAPLHNSGILAPYSRFFAFSCSSYAAESSFSWYDVALWLITLM